MVKKNYPIKARTKQGMTKVLCVLSALALPLPAFAEVDVLPKAEANVEFSAATPVKTYKVVGAVMDSKTNESIIGASVLIKGTSRGVVTDFDGKFELNVKKGDVLVISYMGYTTKTIRIKGQKVLSVTLSEDAKALGEVVVTAFGTGQKKETVSGSIQTIRPKDLKIPTANLSNAFAGRLSGVIAQQKSGEPGSNGSDFYIRGIATLSDVNKPLIIIDGVEMSQGDLNSLDPEVIESFSILKDATASAMYGTRGANGVMIIKTKSGSDLDHPIIGFRLETYMNTPTRVPEIADAVTFMNMYNEAARGTAYQPYSRDKINGTRLGLNPMVYPNVDWYNELFNKATFNERANFNVRGGTSKITYFMNLNAVHETGMLKGRSKDFYSFDNSIDYMKYAFQNNVDFHLSPSSKIGLHLNVQLNNFTGPITKSDGGGMDKVFEAIMGVNPVDFPVMYDQGDDEWVHWGGIEQIGNATINNPLAVATAGYKESYSSTVVANLDFDQKLDFITKGLSFKALFSFKNWAKTEKFRHQGWNVYRMEDYSVNPDGTYSIKQHAEGQAEKHTLGFKSKNDGDNRYYLQAYLNYDRAFGKHNVSAMALYNQDEYNVSVVGEDGIKALPRRKVGLAFRATYDYDHRYMLEFNAGYNGSESFAEGHRWGLFPSISGAWNVSQEKFWEPIKDVVNSFKLRASYGLVGNDRIGAERFIYLPELVLHGGKGNPEYRFGYGDNKTSKRSGPMFKRLANNEITWEIGRKLNLGVDLKLFKSLNITADVFQEIRSNIFQEKKTIPKFLGADGTKIYGNYAKVKNWGLDLAVDYGKQINDDLSIQMKGTFTFARNEVLEYDEAPNLRPALKQVGKRLKLDKGFVANGLYIDQADIANNPTSTLGNLPIAPGDIKYVDQPDAEGNYDGKITDDDKVYMDNPYIPEIIYGFGPSITYKQWDFGCFFQGQANVTIMMRKFEPFGTNARRNVLQWIADDYWSADHQNIDALYPRLTVDDNNNNKQYSTHWAKNAAFLKLKSAELGYRFKNARVYFSATNLFTISPFKYWDPAMGGGSGMSYPLQRTFNLGLQLTFK